MSGENDIGTEADAPAVVVVTGEGATVESGGSGEVEAAGEVADAAVQIAQIQADRDVALAVIEGENSERREEAFAENFNEDLRAENARLRGELDECRNTITTLETTVAALTPPPPSEPEPPPSPPENPPAAVADDPPAPASPEAEAPEPPSRRAPKLRWI